MKIFISHSWKDKTFAQRVADSFEKAADVWLDLDDLFPGQNIQNVIDAAIGEMDLFILLWSVNSSESANVQKEIDSALRTGVEILPCLLDDTPLDDSSGLSGVLGIDCSDQKMGLFRIQIFAMRRLGESIGSAVDMDALNDLKSYEGALDYVNNYRNKQGITGSEDGAYWTMQILEKVNRSNESLSAARDRIGNILEFMQSKVAEIQDAGEDRTKLNSIRNDLLNSEFRDTEQGQMLIKFVEGTINSSPPE